MAAPCPVNSCCAGNVICLQVFGCGGKVYPGCSVSAVQSGVTQTATTDGTGTACFSFPTTVFVAFSVTPTNTTRFNNGSVNITPVVGVTTNRTMTLTPKSGYVCVGDCSGNTCLFPAPTTLHFTTPAGHTITLTHSGGTYQGSESITAGPYCDGSLGGNPGVAAMTVGWSCPASNLCPMPLIVTCSFSFSSDCNYPAPTSVTAFSSPHVANWSCVSCVSGVTGMCQQTTQSSFTCPLQSSLNATGTALFRVEYAGTNTYVSGSWTLTE